MLGNNDKNRWMPFLGRPAGGLGQALPGRPAKISAGNAFWFNFQAKCINVPA
jgi:hypothetical protein